MKSYYVYHTYFKKIVGPFSDISANSYIDICVKNTLKSELLILMEVIKSVPGEISQFEYDGDDE